MGATAITANLLFPVAYNTNIAHKTHNTTVFVLVVVFYSYILLSRNYIAGSQRSLGLRTQNSGAPGYAMLFALIQKQILELRKYSSFNSLNAVQSYKFFFSTLLAFHSYQELFVNHDQCMRLIFDTGNGDVSRFKG